MSLDSSLIPVRKIVSHVPRSTFLDEQIEQTAKAILDAEGIINPIIVRQLSFQEFEVVEGHLEYYAAVRARELDLARGEMTDVIILEPENEAAVLAQIELLRTSSQQSEASTLPETPISDSRITNLEKFIEKQFSELNQKHLEEKRKLEVFIQEMQAHLPKPLEPLIFFNSASVQELSTRFKRIGLDGKRAEKVILSIESERKNGAFISLIDVRKRVKGLSETKLLSLLENA